MGLIMPASTRLKSSAEVIQVTAQGPILRVSFSGICFDGVGKELGNYLVAALTQYQPAAVVLDFTHFRYKGGDDLGQIVQAFITKDPDGKAVLRPCAIVAAGRTAKALLSLLSSARFLDTFDLRFFEDVSSAEEDLAGETRSAACITNRRTCRPLPQLRLVARSFVVLSHTALASRFGSGHIGLCPRSSIREDRAA